MLTRPYFLSPAFFLHRRTPLILGWADRRGRKNTVPSRTFLRAAFSFARMGPLPSCLGIFGAFRDDVFAEPDLDP